MLPRRCYLGLMRVVVRKIVLMHGVCMCVRVCFLSTITCSSPLCTLSQSPLSSFLCRRGCRNASLHWEITFFYYAFCNFSRYLTRVGWRDRLDMRAEENLGEFSCDSQHLPFVNNLARQLDSWDFKSQIPYISQLQVELFLVSSQLWWWKQGSGGCKLPKIRQQKKRA